MKLKEIVDSVYKKTYFSKDLIYEIIKSYLATLEEELLKTKKCRIHNLCKIYVGKDNKLHAKVSPRLSRLYHKKTKEQGEP